MYHNNNEISSQSPIYFRSSLWNRSDTMINEYISEWAPCLGRAGQQVSLFRLDPGFFYKVYPDKKEKVEGVGALVDGKIIQTEEPRSSNHLKRMMYSNKTSSTGALYIDCPVASASFLLLCF